ncbi:MAG: ABC transporter substrate-binding protein [Rhodobacteraceae bacterium]|nr:ABC transporter substrate-binding protein [Paracoccaceae bacterium]
MPSVRFYRGLARAAAVLTLAAQLFMAQLATAYLSTAQAATLRLGLFGLPSHGGNPYSLAGMPDILTMSAMFDGLTRFDANGTLHPWLAVAWENVDQLTWIIRLRQDVRFSNGTPFTSQAVVSAVDYLTSEAATAEGVATELNFLKTAEAVDDFTVRIVTKVPSPMLPRYLPILYMVEPGAWQTLGPQAFSRAPVGTGPFTVASWRPNGIVFDANRDSWRPPRIDKLEIRAVPDVTARLQALLSGQLDIAYSLGPDDKLAVEDIGARFLVAPSEEVRVISFITTRDTPLRNVLVRRALNLAVDRAAINDALLGGVAPPATQGATRGSYGFDPSLPPFDYRPEEAKQLLRAAGLEDGFTFSVELVSGSTANDMAIIQRIAEDLSKVGVRMDIRQVTIQEFLRDTATGSWQADSFIMVFPVVPPMDVLRPLRLHSCLRPLPWFCDPSVMPAIDAAFSEFDPVKQVEQRRALMAWERDQVPALFLWEDVRFIGLAPGVENFEEINGFINYDRITLSRKDR